MSATRNPARKVARLALYTGAVIVLAALAAGWHVARRTSREARDPAGPETKPEPQAAAIGDASPRIRGAESQARAAEGTADRAPKTETARAARAMDLSAIRGLVQSLKEAVVAGNDRVRRATADGIGRYGGLAKPLLEQEIAAAGDARVRAALAEALDGIRRSQHIEEEGK